MSSPRSTTPNSWRFESYRAAERKSRSYAVCLTFGIGLLVNLILLWTPTVGVSVPQKAFPLRVELRRVPPPVSEPEPQEPEDVRKLVSETATPESLVVAEPAKPEILRKPDKEAAPEPKPRKKSVAEKKTPPRAERPKENLRTQPDQPDQPAEPADMSEPERSEEPRDTAAEQGEGEALATERRMASVPVSSDTLGGRKGSLSGDPEAAPNRMGEILAVLLDFVESNKRYPRQARRLGIEGEAVLRVSISESGRVVGYAIASGSGKSLLDAALARLGDDLVGKEIPPARGRAMDVLVPISYSLNN